MTKPTEFKYLVDVDWSIKNNLQNTLYERDMAYMQLEQAHQLKRIADALEKITKDEVRR